MNVRILLADDKEKILEFERGRLAQTADPVEAEFLSWGSSWRPEALEHYLPQGWSFGYFGPSIMGYILAQPYLFHRALAQTLWIEQLTYESPEIGQALIDTVYRWARDKHFQCVLCQQSLATQFILDEYKQAHIVEAGYIELRSAKF